ncbi:hypothetical protein [Leptospira stimsonii]|uniref:Uncharacterized protein n=1 Tax=Leptospira stimsonii TaxID=2202203 RepID=A0A396ZH60_9LEPT|nr:hypothetical protein [Leptospira stimsonii]RHX93016.1 hypothetical protein DLM75_07655 [Leptospira stimsonii]
MILTFCKDQISTILSSKTERAYPKTRNAETPPYSINATKSHHPSKGTLEGNGSASVGTITTFRIGSGTSSKNPT